MSGAGMSGYIWLIVVGLLLGAIVLPLVVRRVRQSALEARFCKAMRDFHHQREYLEAKFVELCAASGKPRGLAWETCDFEDDVAYARHRQSGDLSALVGVTISFSAIEGGGMEDVEAVGDLRAATAVFNLRDGRWTTAGRAIFNLNPTEAISHYRENLEMVARDYVEHV